MDDPLWPQAEEPLNVEDYLSVKITKLKAYDIAIYCGLKVRETNQLHDPLQARTICRQYCDQVGFCVNIERVYYIYKNGEEPGIRVGIIQYPRFPSKPKELEKHAIALAKRLLFGMQQGFVTIVTPKKSIMLENEEITSGRTFDASSEVVENS